jgi:Big-like domain-containing protein
MKTNTPQKTQWLTVSLLVLILGSFELSKTEAANILFVINTVVDPNTATLAQDQELRDRLVGQGHTVTLADDQDPLLGDLFPGKDLILISSSVGSGSVPLNGLSSGTLRPGRIPVVCAEPGLYDELLFQTQNTFGNAGGHTSLSISTANQGHPLAAGKSGTIEIVEPGLAATVNSSALPYTVGTNAIIIATNATPGVDVGRINTWGFERGSLLANNSTLALSRRVALFMNASTVAGVYNTNAYALIDAAITWALAAPPPLPILVIWRSPANVNAAPGATLTVELEDGTTSLVNTNAISLLLNGTAVAPLMITQTGSTTTVSFQPTTVSPAGSTNTATVVYANKDVPPVSFTNVFQFVVENYVTIPARLAYPVGSGDAATPGFRVRIAQANTTSGTLVNSEERAESQLAGKLIDPATGQSYANDFNPGGADANGFFTDADIVNWNQDAGLALEQGNFRDPSFPDEPIPGIPGIDGVNTDNIAGEVLTYLDLTAGVHRFGVNSDDGFVLAVGVEARDLLRIPLGRFDGGRGSADSIFSFIVETNGVYSFRLLWYEGNGGANLELFSVDAASGAKIPVNDRTNAQAIRASRQVTAPARPFVIAISPAPRAVRVPVDAAIDCTITNGATTVNTNTIQARLDGQLVPLTSITASGNTVRFVADPTGNLAGTTQYRVTISFNDSAGAAFSSEYRFTTVRPPITAPPIQQDDAGLAVFEAENFDADVPQGVHTWEFDRTPAGYSGEGTMYALPDAPGAVIDQPNALTLSPRLDYKVSLVKTGLHYFWFRGSDGGGDSLNAGIDGDSPDLTMNNIDSPDCCGTRLVPGGVSFTWNNGIDLTPEGRSQFNVTTPGVHTISIWMREDGQIVDKFLITTDLNFDPNLIAAGLGPPESARVGAAVQPRFNPAVLAGGNITISWTGTGTLEQTDSLSPPNWGPASSQTNPQTVPATGTRFYRIRQ